MHKLEAIKVLEVKSAAIEREHHAEFAGDEDMRDQTDAKAEARALAAVFDFLKDCKISHRDSLLAFLNATCAESRPPDEGPMLLLCREPRVFLPA
jgi:hypothetical protein